MSPKDNDTLDEMLGQLQGTKTNTTKFITKLGERVGEEGDVLPGPVHRYSTAGHEIGEQQIDLKTITKPVVPNSTGNLIKKMINDVSKTINFNPKHNERRECLACNVGSGDGSGAAADVTREGILRTRVGSEGGGGSVYTRNCGADDEYTATYTMCSNTLTDVSCTINENNNSKRVKSSNNNNNSNNSDDNDANNIKTNPHDCFNETMRAALSLGTSTTRLALVAENLQQFSDQKTLEASTSKSTKAVKEISGNTQEQHQCEPLELTRKTLAERKALLKKEFFQEFHTAASTGSLRSSSGALGKRVLKRQHNLKLKIPSAEVLENIPLPSLVAQRKLTLSQKFEKQTEVKSGVKQPQRAVKFPQIQELVKKFDIDKKMLVTQLKDREIQEKATLKPFDGSGALEQRSSPLSDEGCNLGQSPYSSDNDDDDDNESIRTTNTAIERPVAMLKYKDKVARSASSDSALGLDVEEAMDASPPANEHHQKRRMTLTVTDLPLRAALLPLAEPTTLPDSPTPERELVAQIPLPTTPIPSKVLLEERVVEIPEDHRSGISSRRESSQSCLSDFPPNEMQGIRFVRTPSVVVSDYSDDIMCGITLEEIEYFRAQRQRRRRSSLDTATDNNSDVSAASSCSNLYYCGSTISALDGAECLVNGERMQLERKTSDCSITCSLSGDEDGFTIREQPEGNSDHDGKDITDMLAAQHLGAKRSKKTELIRKDGKNNWCKAFVQIHPKVRTARYAYYNVPLYCDELFRLTRVHYRDDILQAAYRDYREKTKQLQVFRYILRVNSSNGIPGISQQSRRSNLNSRFHGRQATFCGRSGGFSRQIGGRQ
uniref:Uncharacterized protein n=1 Tax=Glossina morsitans morsitans TaxID=37546 RepID=A0A1A9YUK5_GLOMM